MSQGFQFDPQSQEFKIPATSFTFTPPKLPISPEQEVIKKALRCVPRVMSERRAGAEILVEEEQDIAGTKAVLCLASRH